MNRTEDTLDALDMICRIESGRVGKWGYAVEALDVAYGFNFDVWGAIENATARTRLKFIVGQWVHHDGAPALETRHDEPLPIAYYALTGWSFGDSREAFAVIDIHPDFDTEPSCKWVVTLRDATSQSFTSLREARDWVLASAPEAP